MLQCTHACTSLYFAFTLINKFWRYDIPEAKYKTDSRIKVVRLEALILVQNYFWLWNCRKSTFCIDVVVLSRENLILTCPTTMQQLKTKSHQRLHVHKRQNYSYFKQRAMVRLISDFISRMSLELIYVRISNCGLCRWIFPGKLFKAVECITKRGTRQTHLEINFKM